MSANVIRDDETEASYQPVAFEARDLEDRALLQRLTEPGRHEEEANCTGILDGRARVKRTLAEVNALERLAWRGRVTLLLVEADMLALHGGVVSRKRQADYWRQYDRLRDELGVFYGAGAIAAFDALGDEPEEEETRSHAEVAGLRLLQRLSVLLNCVDQNVQ
jgi:hypothetical protein